MTAIFENHTVSLMRAYLITKENKRTNVSLGFEPKIKRRNYSTQRIVDIPNHELLTHAITHKKNVRDNSIQRTKYQIYNLRNLIIHFFYSWPCSTFNKWPLFCIHGNAVLVFYFFFLINIFTSKQIVYPYGSSQLIIRGVVSVTGKVACQFVYLLPVDLTCWWLFKA